MFALQVIKDRLRLGCLIDGESKTYLSKARLWSVFVATLVSVAPCLTRSTGLSDLATPQEGRSMRSTSTMRVGEVRRGGGERKLDPKAEPRGDLSEESNYDNFTVPPGETHVLMDEKGPGVITHIWMTFLGPEPQDWAKQGAANHQEMLLRMYWDGDERPAVEAPVGDFFANCFGKRSEVISLPVIVEDADSYNCFWHMPFRKSARIEIVNQSEKQISLLYYNIDWIKKKKLPKDTPYFYAQYRQEYPAQAGQGLRGAGDRGQRPLCRHRAGRAHPQPIVVRRRG